MHACFAISSGIASPTTKSGAAGVRDDPSVPFFNRAMCKADVDDVDEEEEEEEDDGDDVRRRNRRTRDEGTANPVAPMSRDRATITVASHTIALLQYGGRG